MVEGRIRRYPGTSPPCPGSRFARADAETELASRYGPGLIAFLRHRVGDASRAEDLCQETFKVAIENIRAGAPRDPAHLGAYLRGIALNLSRRDRRDAWRRTALEAIPEPTDPGADPRECMLSAERVRRVRLVIQSLPARDRSILTLCYLNEEKKSVGCNCLGLSPAQFDVVKFRALRRFAKGWQSQA